MADFDGDGKPDLLSGSHCCNSFGFHAYLRTATGWGPRRDLTISDDSKAVPALYRIIMARSSVTAADWDGDGAPDLLWGGIRGIGVARGPFADGRPIDVTHTLDFTPLPATVDESVHSPTVVDWDADGKPDLLAGLTLDGGRGGLYWFRNLGGPGLTRLAPGELLLSDAAVAGPTPKMRTVYGYCAGDFDGDGRPDLIVTWRDLTSMDAAGKWVGSAWLFRRE